GHGDRGGYGQRDGPDPRAGAVDRPDDPGASRADADDRRYHHDSVRASRPIELAGLERGDRGGTRRRAGQEFRSGGTARARAGRALQGGDGAGERYSGRDPEGDPRGGAGNRGGHQAGRGWWQAGAASRASDPPYRRRGGEWGAGERADRGGIASADGRDGA